VIALAAASSQSTSAWDEPGTIAFLVVFGMGVVLYFVFRSLVKHLKKINDAARAEAAAQEAEAARNEHPAQAAPWSSGNGSPSAQ
jgi:hypothetical protein